MSSESDPSGIAARFPGPVTLYPSRRKWLVILAGCVVFAIGGYFMIQEGADGGWFVFVSFGLGSLIAVVPLVPGSGRLTLDRDGFTAVNMFRSTRTRWRDTSGFETATLPPASHKMVVFDDASRKGTLASVNVGLTGRNSALPDTYGLSTEDLASIMESWRGRALGP